MALSMVHFFSPALQKACSMTVLLPDTCESEGPYSVLYLLHGLSDDHTIWQRRTSVERYAADLPLIIVMPDGGRSFYCDAAHGPAYEAHIIQDVIGFVDRFYHTKACREGRAIEGLSMGGYGALKLGLKYPDLFGSIVAHSSCPLIASEPLEGREDLEPELRRIFGDSPLGGKDDLLALAERLDPKMAPPLRMDCGTEDFLLDQNRRFHARLEELGVPHEYEEFPGSHEWGYWDQRVQEGLAFHRRALGV